MKFCTITHGCKVNQYETQAIEKILRDRGNEPGIFGEGNDICILNTCAVTAESVRKARQTIRRIKKLEPDAKLVVRGCYSQLEPNAVAALGADQVIGTPQTFEELPPGSTASRTRALLKIQDGCNNFCTYCIVPYIRGRSRSLPLEKITQYAKQLEQQDYKEIVIVGIEISSYGVDLQKQRNRPLAYPTLLTAIQTIHAAAPKTRLRLGSLAPNILTNDFCKELGKIPNLCNHFHLSLQSGCDETLQRMGRKYTSEEALQTIKSLRKHFPDCGITADLITGFPGETDDEFDLTLGFIEKANFSGMHIFPYSLRPGTKAAKMPGHIEKAIKKERAKKAAETAYVSESMFKKTQIGKTVEVLIEQEKNGISSGHSTNYLEVEIKGKLKRNSIRNVKIAAIKNGKLQGEII